MQRSLFCHVNGFLYCGHVLCMDTFGMQGKCSVHSRYYCINNVTMHCNNVHRQHISIYMANRNQLLAFLVMGELQRMSVKC